MGSLDLRISDVNWGLQPTPSPLNGERAGVRGEKAKSFEFPKVRFMERTDLQLSDAHWGHEPAPSPLNGERAGVRGEKAKSFEFPRVRFMDSERSLRSCACI